MATKFPSLSRLAANTLKKGSAKSASKSTKSKPKPPAKPKPPTVKSTKTAPKPTPPKAVGAPATPAATPAPTAAVNMPEVEPNAPVVNVHANGQLDLPYDEEFAWNIFNANNSIDQQLLGLQQQQQQQGLSYLQQKRDAGQSFQDLQLNTLNRDAARGMAFSSGHGNHLAQNTTNYNNFLNDLESGNTLANQGFSLSRGQLQSSLNEMLRMAAERQAEQAAKNAGQLGLGGTPEPDAVTTPAPAAGGKPTILPNIQQTHIDAAAGSSKPKTQIEKLLAQGLDKSQVVAKLSKTKDNQGGASKLSNSQLRQIGFSDDFIAKLRKK